MELEKPTPLIFDYLPEPARLVRPVHGAITDGEVIGKADAVPPVPLAAGPVGGAGEKPSPLGYILRAELHLVRCRQPEELLAHLRHVLHRLLEDAVVDHLHLGHAPVY